MQIIGGSYRMNAECPYCGSLDRERLVDQFLKNRSLLNTGMQILHIAPEKNLQRMMKQKGINLVSADLDSPLASLKMDIQQIPFPDDHFDAIICNHVLEHIPDDIKAMHELYRVLKPGGWAILQVPFSPLLEHSYEDPTITDSKDRARIFGQKDHVRIYGLDYPSRLQSVGFKVEAEKLDPTLIKRFALNPREIVFFCRK
jgi:SAM-dependent methyltransferase